MRVDVRVLLGAALLFGVPNLQGCGGKSELGSATSVPPVDQKKLEEERKKSMEKGGMKGPPPGAPPTTTQ